MGNKIMADVTEGSAGGGDPGEALISTFEAVWERLNHDQRLAVYEAVSQRGARYLGEVGLTDASSSLRRAFDTYWSSLGHDQRLDFYRTASNAAISYLRQYGDQDLLESFKSNIETAWPTMNHQHRLALFNFVLDAGLKHLREASDEDLAQTLISQFETIWPDLNYDHRVALFSSAIQRFAGYIRENGEYGTAAFHAAEAAGVHVLPTHYYSPIPVVSELNPDHYLSRILPREFDFGYAQDVKFFDEVALPFASELAGIPMKESEVAPGEMYWENGMYNAHDAVAYYGLLRGLKPKQVLEVGSGFSTLIAVKAAKANGNTTVRCIEPYPTEYFSKHLVGLEGIQLITKKVQETPLHTFGSLGEGDVLFIDSSHVAKPGSDVEFLIFKVLPILQPGVIVHFHDIYLPYGYPIRNARELRFWNENYLVGAFLSGNPDWEIVLSNCRIDTMRKDNRARIGAAIEPNDPEKAAKVGATAAGGSLWIRRVSAKTP